MQEEPQPFNLDLDGGNHFPPVKSLSLAQEPEAAIMGLYMQGIDSVPLDMVGTGPKVLAIAGRHADRVSTAVGADPERVAWAICVAKEAREAAGVDRPMKFGSWVPLVVTDDIAEGRRMLSGSVASMARFTAMHGKAPDAVGDNDRKVYERVHDAYQMQGHFREGSPQSKEVPDEFFDRFAVIGPADYCIDRLGQLAELGVDRFVISSPSAETTPEMAAEANQRFVEDVMPAVKG